ncbi:uncharacterized protein LOC124160141 [Ischnura elegans]|uniref:uncharacterized protein LOC124160141 n=1 Tax=Ischnura elegans TaxID=197161 RepID=UPI001ED87E25|nr:uncharacterized protein LOC124160141 [Ischnura elegans]
MEESQQRVNGGGREGEGRQNQGRQDAERPPSALSNASTSISCTASSASLPRTSPLLLSPTNSTSSSTNGPSEDIGAAMETPGAPPILIEATHRPRPNSGGGIAQHRVNAQGGLFRRSKSTPSLQQGDGSEGVGGEAGGRRSLWGWGQRPLLPPTHFYYCPHTPPRNKELRPEDIPVGVDRVKALKERIESLPMMAAKGEEREGAVGQKAALAGTVAARRRTLNGALNTKPPTIPYRTPSFGGSMTQLNHKSSTMPLRGGGAKATIQRKDKESNSDQDQKQEKRWSSTLPRDGVQTIYWNGISTIGRKKPPSNASQAQNGDGLTRTAMTNTEEVGEVRVSASTLERIRARGSSVTYFGGRVVKQGGPADPTLAIMEEICRQRAAEVQRGSSKWTKVLPGDWPPPQDNDEEDTVGGGRDSSYGSAESTPTPSAAPTPPLPPASPPRTPSPPAKVVSAMAKGEGGLQRPLWSGQCSVVFDFRPGKAREGGKLCY